MRTDNRKEAELVMNKGIDKFGGGSKRLAFLYSILLVIPLYGILVVTYYVDYLNGFLFLGLLLVIIVCAMIFLIIFRKVYFKRITLIFAISLLLILWGYEALLLDYESNTYLADGYREPEELLAGSGIHVLSVGLFDIHYIEDEDMIKDIYERDDIEIFELEKVNNRDRYWSKNRRILDFFRIGKDDFQIMGDNVRSYVGEDFAFINEFLNRENLVGDSAGLALGLIAMAHQGELENKVTLGVTGTLEHNGEVMEVGGIKSKVMISALNGFPYIIVPQANLEEAEAVKTKQKLTIEIIPVSHINEAVLAINDLHAED